MSGTTRSISLQTPNTTCWRERELIECRVLSPSGTLTSNDHLKYDHEAELERQDLPMVGGVVSLVVPEPSVPVIRTSAPAQLVDKYEG